MHEDASLVDQLVALGHPTRSAILLALFAGEARSAGQLGHAVRASSTTLSYHLRVLLDARLVAVTRVGRRRIFELANLDVADALEALLRSMPPRGQGSARSSALDIARARSCYDHLAGRLGVEVTQALVRNGILDERAGGFELGLRGERWFSDLGANLDIAREARRSFARSCLDWTERRPHLAGALGAELLFMFLKRGWVQRVSGSRALKVTPTGVNWLAKSLGLKSVDAPPVRPMGGQRSRRTKSGE